MDWQAQLTVDDSANVRGFDFGQHTVRSVHLSRIFADGDLNLVLRSDLHKLFLPKLAETVLLMSPDGIDIQLLQSHEILRPHHRLSGET